MVAHTGIFKTRPIEDFYWLRSYPRPFGNPAGEIHIPNWSDPHWADIEDHKFDMADSNWPIAFAVGGKHNEDCVYWDERYSWTWDIHTPLIKTLYQLEALGLKAESWKLWD